MTTEANAMSTPVLKDVRGDLLQLAGVVLVTAWNRIRRAGWPLLASGNVIAAGCQSLVLITFTQFLSMSDVGQYTLMLAWITPIAALCSLQLRGLMATDARLLERLDDYRSLRVVGLLVFVALIVIPASMVPRVEWWLLLAVGAATKAVEMIADYSYGIRLHTSRFDEIAFSQGVRSVSMFAGVLITAWWSRDLQSSLSIQLVVVTSSVVLIDVNVVRMFLSLNAGLRCSGSMQFPVPNRRHHLRFAVDVGLLREAGLLAAVMALNTGMIAIPRLFLDRWLTKAEVARFSCGTALVAIAALFTAAYAARFSSSLGDCVRDRRWVDFRARVRELVKPLRVTVPVVLLGGPLVGGPVLRTVFGPTYEMGIVDLVGLSVFGAMWCTASVLGTAATALRELRGQLAAYAAAVFVLMLFAPQTIQTFGISGAIWSLAFSAVVLVAIQSFVLDRALRADTGLQQIPLAMIPSPIAPSKETNPSSAGGVSDTNGSPVRKRVLHVCGKLGIGGAEVWLLRLLTGDDAVHAVSVLSIANTRGDLENSFRAAGIPVLQLPLGPNPVGFTLSLLRLFRSSGPWDVVHSHLFRRSSLVLLAAWIAQIPTRIAHCHHAETQRRGWKGLASRIAAFVASHVINYVSTGRIACSIEAAETLYGVQKAPLCNLHVMPCGVDVQQIVGGDANPSARATFGLPDDAIVIAHVGRFAPVKNHKAIIRIAREIAQLDERAYFLFLGEGYLRQEIEGLAQKRDILSRCRFPGAVSDVPTVLRSCANGFILASHHEGVSVAAIEAQLAGLPCLIADHLSDATIIFPHRTRRFGLKDGEAAVGRTMLELINSCPVGLSESDRELALRSNMNISTNRQTLLRLYQSV